MVYVRGSGRDIISAAVATAATVGAGRSSWDLHVSHPPVLADQIWATRLTFGGTRSGQETWWRYSYEVPPLENRVSRPRLTSRGAATRNRIVLAAR